MLVLRNTRKQNTLYLDKDITIDHHNGVFNTVKYTDINFIEYWNNELKIRMKKNFEEIIVKGITHAIYLQFTNFIKAKLNIEDTPSLDTL